MPHCHIHGWYSSDDGACVVCRDAEARARRGPGDYQCPHCRYISLLKDADICPICHSAIDPQLWQRIAAQEAAAAKAAEKERRLRERLESEEWERARPAREAAARREAASAKLKLSAKTVVFTPIGCVVGALAGGVAGLVISLVVGIIFEIAFKADSQHGFMVWLRNDGLEGLAGVITLAGALIGVVIALGDARK